jgi:hypothetical protein
VASSGDGGVPGSTGAREMVPAFLLPAAKLGWRGLEEGAAHDGCTPSPRVDDGQCRGGASAEDLTRGCV